MSEIVLNQLTKQIVLKDLSLNAKYLKEITKHGVFANQQFQDQKEILLTKKNAKKEKL